MVHVKSGYVVEGLTKSMKRKEKFKGEYKMYGSFMSVMQKRIASVAMLFALFLMAAQTYAADTSLNFISFTSLSDKGVELHLTFSGPPPEPESFTTNNPERITFDLAGVTHNLPWSLPLPVEVGAADTVSAIEASGRTRVVVNLKEMVAYETRIQGNSLYITLGASGSGSDAAAPAVAAEEVVVTEPESTPAATGGQTNALEDVSFVALPGDRALVTLRFSGLPPKPESFTIDEPARIALDFSGTANKLPWRTRNIGIGMARSVTVVEADGRTRVVLNLVKLLPYETRVEGKTVSITLKSEAAARSSSVIPLASDTTPFEVVAIDFRRGEGGEGRVIVTLSDSDAPVDTREAGGRIFVDFPNSRLPEELHERLDVMDFATPIQFVDATSTNNQAQLTISPKGPYEYLAFQSGNTFTIEVKPVTKDEKDGEIDLSKYTGEKLSLNFQDIEVRAVLQLLADFTGLNMVTSDTVQGSLTLRLKNVPWDQALDIILKTKGLGMRQSGNVIMVAPGEEIAAREKLELEAQRQVEELVPLKSELIEVNYAKAKDLSDLLASQDNTLLSARGKISVDGRTNTLLILDTADRLAEIRKLIAKLDVPIRQVLIESRIVIANDNFAKELGVKFGVTGVRQSSDNLFMTTGKIGGSDGGTDPMVGGALDNIINTGQPNPIPIATGDDANPPQRLNFNLPAAGNAGSIAFAILGSNTLIDLELSALQTEGKGEVVSSPRVITSDQMTAEIRQGTQIPFSEASSSGATSVQFKDAVLSLSVTPHITPDDRVMMDLKVTKDSVGQVVPTGDGGAAPSIDTRSIETQVLVKSGETVVLGGIHEQVKRHDVTKVPFFGDIPFIGALFRNKSEVDQNTELLIFVTPKVLKDNINLN